MGSGGTNGSHAHALYVYHINSNHLNPQIRGSNDSVQKAETSLIALRRWIEAGDGWFLEVEGPEHVKLRKLEGDLCAAEVESQSDAL